MTQALMLKNRGLLKLTGEERKSFLQGLVTSDMDRLTPQSPLYAAFLTPQGKYLFDFILYELDDAILVDCELSRAEDLWKRLMMFKLRAKVEIGNLSDESRIWALWGDDDIPYPTFTDPRHWKLGRRGIIPKGINLTLGDEIAHSLDPLKAEDYEVERLTLGIPEGSQDQEVDKYFWLECRAEANNGVSFTKGCYIGQEQTTRMKHRTTIKKSLLPVKHPGSVEANMEIVTETGKNAGTMKSVARQSGLAYVRLKYKEESLICNGVPIILL
ncbi:hypothetical protein QGN29_00785 [Temperatibacter marinus]|uniref:CAF17 C-terminal domain-containing protein n=1 Tax=Temperatibacter marinus TaxID=1456591 RepID=A0AA52ECI5_9PROT|nr:hypothetical protein [Temperatibacter marinus]WND02897.1 hypothetical protein QGN29_00785 [Temperatibacter marinus]